jgi:hypothetical protein
MCAFLCFKCTFGLCLVCFVRDVSVVSREVVVEVTKEQWKNTHQFHRHRQLVNVTSTVIHEHI